MVYDLYFHNDMDGIASASVFMDFLRQKGDTVEKYAPLDYLIIPKWKNENFFKSRSKNPAVVLDFPFHPAAAFWFDHHPSTFKKPEWERKFRQTLFHHFDTRYLSCCRMVMEILEDKFNYRPAVRIKELAKWLDIIDGARYKSAGQTIALKEPALKLAACTEYGRKQDDHLPLLVKLLSELPMEKVLQNKTIKPIFAEIQRDMKKSLDFYKNKTLVLGRVVLIDETELSTPTLRFAPLYFHPGAVYVMRMKRDKNSPEFFHFSIGVNPWKIPKKHPHIGELMKRYGGGGHERVGGLEIRGLKKSMKVKEELIEFLNGNDRKVMSE